MIGNKRQTPSDGAGNAAPEDSESNKKRKGSGKVMIKGAWSPEEDTQMLDAVKEYGTDWKKISTRVEGRTAKQCRDRYKLKLDPSINHGPWTPEEDKMLLKYHADLGRQWTKIAKLMPGRTENSVKSRYASLLRSKTKEWTEQDDLLMRQLRSQNVSFQEIAEKHLPHRSEHAVKKRWERLFMRDLAKKIKSEIPALNKVQAKDEVEPTPARPIRLNPTLAAATSSSSTQTNRISAVAPAVTRNNPYRVSTLLKPLETPMPPPVGVLAAPALDRSLHAAAPAMLSLNQAQTSFTSVDTSDVPQYLPPPILDPFQTPLLPSVKMEAQTPEQLLARNRRAGRFKRHSTSTTVMMQLIGEPLQ